MFNVKVKIKPEDCSVLRQNIAIDIIEKSRGEGSLMEQDTIENISWPKSSFFNFLRKKNIFFSFILCQKCFHRPQCVF